MRALLSVLLLCLLTGCGAGDRGFEPEPEMPEAPEGAAFDEQSPNAFVPTADDALSTFAVDVDTGSYTIARRYVTDGVRPPAASVRVEEFVNYFDQGYTA